MDIVDFTDKYLGNSTGVNLTTAGKFSKYVHEAWPAKYARQYVERPIGILKGDKLRYDSERRRGEDYSYNTVDQEADTSSILATMFWRTFIESPAYSKALIKAGASPMAATSRERFVVRHGNGSRYDLMVFDQHYQKEEPSVVESVEASARELEQGWRVIIPTVNFDPYEIEWSRFHPEVAKELITAQKFGLIVARAQRLEFTACTPGTATPVELTAGKTCGSVGLVAKDAQGRSGVTTALHTVGNQTNILVDGQAGTVVSSDVISDSCFIEISKPPLIGTKGCNGPVTGVSPRTYETVSFERVRGGRVDTTVTSWDPGVPRTLSYLQLKVNTTAVTQPGDSGVALVNPNNEVVGFAFCRTGIGEPIEYSTWIWAESVFKALQLA